MNLPQIFFNSTGADKRKHLDVELLSRKLEIEWIKNWPLFRFENSDVNSNVRYGRVTTVNSCSETVWLWTPSWITECHICQLIMLYISTVTKIVEKLETIYLCTHLLNIQCNVLTPFSELSREFVHIIGNFAEEFWFAMAFSYEINAFLWALWFLISHWKYFLPTATWFTKRQN